MWYVGSVTQISAVPHGPVVGIVFLIFRSLRADQNVCNNDIIIPSAKNTFHACSFIYPENNIYIIIGQVFRNAALQWNLFYFLQCAT